MPRLNRRLRWLAPFLVLLVWLVGVGPFGQYAGKLGEVQGNDNATFLPAGAESTKVRLLEERFSAPGVTPLIVIWEDGKITEEQRAAAGQALQAAVRTGVTTGTVSPPIPSEDGGALQAVIPLKESAGEPEELIDKIETALGEVPGTRLYLAGPAALQADLSSAFAGIDSVLLLVALGVVLIILLLVYRSLVLPLIVIVGAVLALALACALVYFLADAGVLKLNGQTQGIMFILVVGAATDYALLMAVRAREELAGGADRWRAAAVAWRRSLAPIGASALTVALGLLTLLFSDLNSNRSLGPVAAIGIGCAMLSALTFLPAALALLGRKAYWPTRPGKAGTAGTAGVGVWTRVADLIGRHPRRVWIATTLVLVGFAALAPTLKAGGIPQTEVFLSPTPAVRGQEALARHFPAGTGNPGVIITRAGAAAAVTEAAGRVDGVVNVRPGGGSGGAPAAGGRPREVGGLVKLEATLSSSPDGLAAQDTIKRLRTAVHAVPGADALVGGYTATQLDTRVTSEHDRRLIIPIALAVIAVILALLLRAVVAPLLLIATVVLSFAATLGISAVVFNHLFGFTGADPVVPLFGFIFLVALGVDYNIFLMTRVREETIAHGTREGVRRGLVATGGVITSAGVVLAATFGALAVIPLVFLVQIAFIVAFGVVLDTLVVRSLLVPALVYDLGDRTWWPASPASRANAAAETREEHLVT
ncbi:MMPL family transporter [Spirillospora sp. NPDC047279]|uniref:MMPL family transporter n=1 Tax=Spirillospora sp. NPDC047279 TaxID=3155478 RepID=UPI0033FF4E14